MTTAEKLQKIKDLFKKPEKDKGKFAEIALEDGTILMVEGEMVAGVPVMVKTEEGTAPAKPGEYKMPDGSTIVVDEQGMLKEVKAAEVMSEENPEVAALKERVTALENSLKASNEAAAKAAATATEQMAKFQKATEGLTELMQEFIKTPETKADTFIKTPSETSEDKFATMFEGIKSLKK